MNIVERFSTHLREVLAKSIQLAAELNHLAVEPAHVLFALLGQKGSLAAELLDRSQLKTSHIEKVVLALPAQAPQTGQSVSKLLLPAFSSPAKTILEKAMSIAQQNQHSHIGTEHLLLALLEQNDKKVEEVLQNGQINQQQLRQQLTTVLANLGQFPQMAEATQLMDKTPDALGEDLPTLLSQPLPAPKPSAKKETALDFFATRLTDRELQRQIDPVIGRADEIERLIQILCRRTKNNPILLGDPGVGKTAIVEGLAKKIVEGQIADVLIDKEIYALDMGLLIAGTSYRGEFEARLHQIIEEVAGDPNLILFIDEIHNIVGAGSNQGTLDAANLLKPALARGQIRCIGATTPAEFKKFIENDAALERRFQPIQIAQSSLEDTDQILRGIRKNYELYHNIKITDQAIAAATRLADRYITAKALPDKAIDLLDETAAAKRMAGKTPALQTELRQLKQKLDKVITAKEQAASSDQFDQAVKFKTKEKQLVKKIAGLENKLKQQKIKTTATIGEKDVAKQLAKMIKLPAKDLLLTDLSRFKNLDRELKRLVFGQDRTIETVSQLIRRAKLQLSDQNRPLASLLFVGSSGVGKTELAKAMAQTVYPGGQPLIRLDMSEFSEGFGVSKLLGSPAGYVGYKETNSFTDRLKLNPHCLVLFDEIDKAHQDVIKLLLQILEEGHITDSAGKKISLKHAIIVLTTTCGADEAKQASIGFGDSQIQNQEVENRLKDKLKEFFGTEIINRLDKVCWLNDLAEKDLVKIAQSELDQLNRRLEKYQTSIVSKDQIMKWLVRQLPNKINNARDLRNNLNQHIEPLASDLILGQAKPRTEYRLVIRDDKLAVE